MTVADQTSLERVVRTLKFGGTSVADPDRIRHCARRVAAARETGASVVVVVSAMGHTTDHLIDLARGLSPMPSRRELDVLMATGEQASAALMAMALKEMDVPAVSLVGGQLGIETDGCHTRARIRRIDTTRIREALARGQVVVAAGFQGLSPDGDLTTLGRGGSDTTAVAIASALAQEGERVECEIFTDVDGVFTADPRRVPTARRLDRLAYEEMLELSSLGAGVLHSRAVLFGQNFGVPIHVRNTWKEEAGTMVVGATPEMEQRLVVGCALTANLGRVSVRRVPNRPGMQAAIFRRIAEAGILVDDIVQTESDDRANLSFTVDHDDLPEVTALTKAAVLKIGAGEVATETGLAKVSAVGLGMRSHAGVAATMFDALGEGGVHIANITTSEIKVACIVPRDQGEEALRIVHEAFGLGEPIAAPKKVASHA